MIARNGIAAQIAGSGLVLALLLAAPSAAGQTPPAGSGAPPDRTERLTSKEAGREVLNDAGRIWSSPARIKGKDALPLFGLAAATALLIVADESIRDGVQTFAGRHPWAGDVSSVVSPIGGLAATGAAAVFFGAGLVLKDDRARDTGFLAADAILQSFLVDNVIKHLAGRQRPFVTGEDHWSGPGAFFESFERGQADLYTSFHSGHAATAFSLATVVARQYRHSGWVPVVAYALAGGVGLSRIVLDKHWASDVLVGAVIGHFVGRLVVRNHERRRRFVPAVACTGRGFAISLSYDLDPAGY